VGPFKFSFIGEFQAPSVDISPKLVSVDSYQGTRLVDACPRNAPCAGLDGDIQSPDLLSFTDPVARRAMRFDPNIVTINKGSRSVGATFRQPGYWNSGVYIPGMYNGRFWYITNYGLQCNETQSSAIVVQVQTTLPIASTRLLDVVCPSFTIINSTGCYGCAFGFSINILAHSDCLPGSIIVHATADGASLSLGSLSITRSDLTYSIPGLATKSPVDMNLCLGSGDNEHCEQVTLVLIYQTEVLNMTYQNNTENISGQAADDGPTALSFSGLFTNILFKNWWTSLLSSIGIFLMTVFFIWIFYKLLTMMTNSSTTKVKLT